MTLTVFFQDEAPRIGCGWRKIEVVQKGYKWVRVSYQGGQCVRLKRRVWDDIERSARETSH